MDFGDLKRVVNERVVKPCDRKNLNVDVPFLAGREPDGREHRREDLGRARSGRGRPRGLVRVVLHETERNTVVYEGPGTRA